MMVRLAALRTADACRFNRRNTVIFGNGFLQVALPIPTSLRDGPDESLRVESFKDRAKSGDDGERQIEARHDHHRRRHNPALKLHQIAALAKMKGSC